MHRSFRIDELDALRPVFMRLSRDSTASHQRSSNTRSLPTVEIARCFCFADHRSSFAEIARRAGPAEGVFYTLDLDSSPYGESPSVRGERRDRDRARRRDLACHHEADV